jgi:hypothetical protein
MQYKAKVAVCSEYRTKHSTKSEHHVQYLTHLTGQQVPILPLNRYLSYRSTCTCVRGQQLLALRVKIYLCYRPQVTVLPVNRYLSYR